MLLILTYRVDSIFLSKLGVKKVNLKAWLKNNFFFIFQNKVILIKKKYSNDSNQSTQPVNSMLGLIKKIKNK